MAARSPWFGVAFGATALAMACAAPSPRHVTDSPAGAYEPSLAVFRDGLTVAWYDTRNGNGEIYARAIDSDGRPAGPEARLTTGRNNAYEADIHPLEGAFPGDGFVVGWYEKAPDNSRIPRLGVWGRNGAKRWVKTVAPQGRNTVVRVQRGSIFCAWIQDLADGRAEVWGGWWNARGEAIVAPRRLAAAGATTYNLNAALDPAPPNQIPRVWVAFDAKAGTKSEELFLVEDGGDEARVTRLTADDGFPSKYPDLAVSGNRAALTWFDAKDGNEEVYLSVGERDDLMRGDALTGVRVTSTPGHSIGAYIAWNGDRVGVAWCDDTEGQQHEVYFEAFDASGRPVSPTQRLTTTPAASLIPSIRPWRTGFALAWNEYEGGGPGHDEEESRSQVAIAFVQ